MNRYPRRRPLVIEALEDRTAPAVLTVNSPSDNLSADVLLTLREAVALVNNGGNADAALGRPLTATESAQVNTGDRFDANDTIRFAAGANGQPIALTLSSFTISRPVTIRGNGSSNTILLGEKDNADPHYRQLSTLSTWATTDFTKQVAWTGSVWFTNYVYLQAVAEINFSITPAMAQAASTTSWRANSVGSPFMASPSSRS